HAASLVWIEGEHANSELHRYRTLDVAPWGAVARAGRLAADSPAPPLECAAANADACRVARARPAGSARPFNGPGSPWQKSPVAETGGASPSAALLVG